jgi:hypothetical protein
MQIILTQRRDKRLVVGVWCARGAPTDLEEARGWAHANGWEVHTADDGDALVPYRLRFQLGMWPPGTRLAFRPHLGSGATQIDLDDIRVWRATANQLGQPCGLDDFFRENNVCPMCKGNELVTWPFGSYSVQYRCPRCGGTGRYDHPYELPSTSEAVC